MTVTLGRPRASSPDEGGSTLTRPDGGPGGTARPSRPAPTGGSDPVPSGRVLPHLGGLDGVRALAVAAVLIYHAGATWLPGGFLGVDVFFVLSGFLIATLVGQEVETTGGFRAGPFYRRRVARLVPALWVVIAAVALAGLVWRDQLDALRGDLLAGLTYTSNWWQIAAEQSYFSGGGRPPLLRHLWSLAIEAQFYLAAPVLAWVVLRWGRRRLGQVALLAALASAVAMGVLATVWEMPVPFDPSRLYFGTDTHLSGLMVGVALACVWRPWRTWPPGHSWLRGSAATPRWRSGLVADVAGVLALVAVVGVMLHESEISGGLYRGGFLSFSILAALLVAAASHPGSLLGRLLAVGPLRWLGTRSYGVYLWHWPIFALTRPGLDVPGPTWLVEVLRVALVLAVAELSYRYVEVPVRRGDLSVLLRRAREEVRVRRVLLGAGAGVLALVVAVALVPATTSDVEAGAERAESATTGGLVPTGDASVGDGTPGDAVDGGAVDGSEAATGAAAPAPDPTPEAAAPGPVAEPAPPAEPAPAEPAPPAEEIGTLSALGDSVLAMAAPDLQGLGAGVDAVKSRQFREVVDLALAYRDQGTLGHTVVVHGGTNGPIDERDLRRLIEGLTDRRVYLVNIKAPVAWEGFNNELLARVVPEYPQAHLVDWYSAAAAHPEWLYSDTIHPREGDGTRAMTDLIWQAVQPG